jgi:ATP-dependent Clp protease ATP-binding subunit ClpX
MVKTLAKKLGVPFATSNCTSFTQAGYIGEDAEVCVHHLLRAANYDVRAAEHGIIFLDEIDKIATTKMAHGKDVGGEGVQQALLGLLEGTTVQVQPKPERGSGRSPGSSQGNISGFPSNNPLDGSRNPGIGGSASPPSGKGEVYNVRTDNILFIVAGAFPGLEKKVMDRVSARGIGFGAAVRSSKSDGRHETLLSGDEELFKKNLPFYVAPQPPNPVFGAQQPKAPEQTYNILDLVEPSDLQNYGMIPELLGRIPIICAVASLSVDDLVRVLTEPKNSLLEQYERKFRLASGIELRFTNGALYEVAKKASSMSTGARGLRTVMERLLSEAMYETPGKFPSAVL